MCGRYNECVLRSAYTILERGTRFACIFFVVIWVLSFALREERIHLLGSRSIFVQFDDRGNFKFYYDWPRGFWVLPWLWILITATAFFESRRNKLVGRPIPGGKCPTCGYDLRATPNRCPECGKVPDR